MELYASAALAKVGQALHQHRDPFKNAASPTLPRPTVSPGVPSEVPSMTNVYTSDHWNTVRADERMRGMSKWNASQHPFETGVVPDPAYASMFQPIMPSSAPISDPTAAPALKEVRTMAGTTVAREDFVHNNMTPFFRGTLKQNLDPNVTASKLERFTGRSDIHRKKQAVECFFEPTSGFAHVCGAPNSSDFNRERIAPFQRRANDFPIEQVKVGPGLGLGYTAEPEGGFHQAATRDYIMPKSVDELRVATKPKLVPELKGLQGPQKGTTQRGMIGHVDKNRPHTYFEQSADMLLKTTGSQLKDKIHPEPMIKPTSRVDTHVDYQGTAHLAATQKGAGSQDDYGKDGMIVYKNERDTTGSLTVMGNLTSYVKAIVSPLFDVFRHNYKEYTLDAPRVFGNMSAQIPEKPTSYDPVNHMLRTTIKEQTIHDTNILNPRGNDAPPVESDDSAKTTVRETLPVQETTRNVAARTYKVTVYDIDAVARTTIRQTTSSSGSMYGFVGGDVTERPGAYTVIDVNMPATQKQFVSDYSYQGASESKNDFRPMSQEADRNAEIDGTREALNIAAGNTPAAGGAFIGLAKEQIDMDIKRLMSDDVAARQTGNLKGTQTTARPIEFCEVTRLTEKERDMEQAQEGRIERDLLSVLKSNPYSININPL